MRRYDLSVVVFDDGQRLLVDDADLEAPMFHHDADGCVA